MMSDMLFEHFEHWRDRWGWVIGAFIIAAITARYRMVRPQRPPRIFHFVGLAMGLGIGSLLFIPAVPRIITALRLLVIARAPMETSGPFPVATADISLQSVTTSDPAILVQIWYPTVSSPAAVAKLPDSTVRPLSSKVLDQSRLASAEQQFPLLLYAPINGGRRDDNASTAAELASHGYVIMAIDDIDLDIHPSSDASEFPPLVFDYSSAEAFKRFLQIGDRKVRREAERALTALDRLTACATADWRAHVRFDQVGFFGFSFGGATAAEASTFDPRVVAAANLDGSLFGQAAAKGLEAPYMFFLVKDDVFPEPQQLQSPEPGERYYAMFAEQDLSKAVRLVNRRDGFGFRIRNAYHENLSDLTFSRRSFFKSWLGVNPYRVKSIRDAYLLAFFDTYLRGMSSPLLTQSPSPFHEVEILKANQYWLDEATKRTHQAARSQN